jgi:hypothetical protein
VQKIPILWRGAAEGGGVVRQGGARLLRRVRPRKTAVNPYFFVLAKKPRLSVLQRIIGEFDD